MSHWTLHTALCSHMPPALLSPMFAEVHLLRGSISCIRATAATADLSHAFRSVTPHDGLPTESPFASAEHSDSGPQFEEDGPYLDDANDLTVQVRLGLQLSVWVCEGPVMLQVPHNW